ncbi:2'-5' RNA ligase family protein [Rhizobium sp. YIM 134829]|uniref:2'-5' RNA ligase family protein n=1 Tax=Rhizobium sp. YIM 134829 TaxID=3390453 RepID=UPI00397D7297
MDPTDSAPLIVTAEMEAAAQAHFTALRTAHFPPSRNYLAAHITLFHALPGVEQEAVEQALAAEATAILPPQVRVEGIRFLGRGVAYALASPELQQCHRRLVDALSPLLSAQDRQGFRPHITVQNKVETAVARALEAELSAAPLPPPFLLTGIKLWRYRGGPWEAVRDFSFGSAPGSV